MMVRQYPMCLPLSLISSIDYRIKYLRVEISKTSFWPMLAVILKLCNVLDKLSLCLYKTCRILMPKRYTNFTIWSWTPIILPLISEPNFSSREMFHRQQALPISPYSVRMRENADKNNSEYGHSLRSGVYCSPEHIFDYLQMQSILWG